VCATRQRRYFYGKRTEQRWSQLSGNQPVAVEERRGVGRVLFCAAHFTVS
jgi:hypothetical protein